MKVKLTLVRTGEPSVDLSVTAEPTTTVGDLARALRNGDPLRGAAARPAEMTLRVDETVLDRAITLDEAAIGSGSTVSLAEIGSVPRKATEAAGTLRVLEGPDAGRSFPLPAGHSTVGRDPSSRVALTDPLISKLHLRVNVSDHVEVIDAGSANGTLVNGDPVDRAVLLDTDRVTIGDSVVVITAAAHSGAVERAGVVHFNRSPRLDPQYPGVKLKAPEPPEKPQPARLPYLALLAPLIVGAVLLIVSPGNVLSLVFIALSPVLMVASFVDNLLQNRKAWKTARKEFFASVDSLSAELDRLHEAERAGRLSESPAVERVVRETAERTPLLWTRRPEHEAYLSLRLGLGRMPSRHELEMPTQRRGPHDLWEALQRVEAQAAVVEPVPVVENLAASGSLGFSGPLETARGVARGVVAQVAGLHSPAEVVVVALASSASAPAWDWLKWLPHVGSPFSPVGTALASSGPQANSLVSELEELIQARREAAAGAEARQLPAVVVLVEDDAPVERARLIGVAENGPAAGVHLLWVAASLQRIPAACRTFVDVDSDGVSVAGYVHTGYGVEPVVCETLTAVQAHDFARSLAPVTDAGARADDDSDLPRSVSFLQLAGTDLATDPDAVIERWRETHSILTGPLAPSERSSRIKPNLRAVFGQAATEPFALDLRTDGPHALVGGTTGSGKSEFLQAWVLALAAAHSPQRVSFLFVDYKGGAAFAECVQLPHTVGLVTDLSPHLVRRALTSLRAELRYREHLFNKKKVKDIAEFERTGDPDVPPSLIIVVDEFAALASEIPEFVDGVVDVAQRGRSLGLHLILATQRPAGVIRDNLRANTNLRVALRVADEDDSTDVLGSPIAAGFDPAIPGRGAAKTGPNRIRAFQSGYAGGWTTDDGEAAAVDIEELRFGSGPIWEQPVDPEAEQRKAAVAAGPSDIKRVVATVQKAARMSEIPAPRKPWLPELAPTYDFTKLTTKRTDTELVLGVLDDAATQSQPVVSYLPDRDGNMAIIGTGGAGKSSALREVAVAAAVTVRGGPVQVYGLDFAGGALQMLQVLPHVGAIIPGDDEDRMARLLRWLSDLVAERAVRYNEARASTIVEYRKLASMHDEPRILLLLDGMGAFREAYESSITMPWFSMLSQIAIDGRQVGVHLVITGDRAASIPASLSSSIQRRLVLRLANADDYSTLGVPADVLTPSSPPGRGIIDGQEMQVAVIGGDPNVALQARELGTLATAMAKAGVADAPAIESLPESVALSALPVAQDSRPVLGIADDTLAPVGADLEGAFVIAGPPGSGKTTALVTVASALARVAPGTERHLLSPRRSAIAALPVWTSTSSGDDQIAKRITALMKRVSAPADGAPTAIFVESIADFEDSDIERELEDLMRAATRNGHLFAAEADTALWNQSPTFGRPMRTARRGIILQPEEGDDDLLRASFGRIRRGSLPPGRGFLVAGTKSRKLQVAMPDGLAYGDG